MPGALPREGQSSVGGDAGQGEGWRVPTPQECPASGSPVPLGVSDCLSPRRQCEASGRQARPAAAAQAAGTCEKFVKGDERKREEGEAGGCEHLARQPRQLPPRDGILSSGRPSYRAIFHPTPLPPPHLPRGGARPGTEVGPGSSCFCRWPLPEACLEQGQPLCLWSRGRLPSGREVNPAHPPRLSLWAWRMGKLVSAQDG